VAKDRWIDFIEWARRARAKPTFDAEERDYRLAVAGAVRDLIEAADDPRQLGERVTAVRRQRLKSLEPLVPGGDLARLEDWAAEDEQGLAQALRPFSEAVDPVDRFDRFVLAVENGPGADRFAGGGLVAGSLLNFGASPEQLPVVRPFHFRRVRELLGEGAPPSATIVEEYRRSLAFAHEVESALRDAGVPVRDMTDVESLITVCSMQHELWTGRSDAADSRRDTEPDVYLAVCAMYRNEAAYLAEWIEFHRLVGVERFFLYDNESDDDSGEVLAPYVEQGIVVRHEQPGSAATSQAGLDQIKIPAFHHCLATHGPEARWIAFIDTDEFLFSPTGRPLSELLPGYERWPAVAVNGALFGTSGHVTRPEGLVLENYTTRLDRHATRRIKSIVDPAAVTRCLDAHKFEARRGMTVDENGYPISWEGNRYWRGHMTKSPSLERLRINHYFARSEEDLRAKQARRAADWVPRPVPTSEEVQESHTAGVTDETILTYLAPLRAALRQVAGRRSKLR
jgi:hypothetical protein